MYKMTFKLINVWVAPQVTPLLVTLYVLYTQGYSTLDITSLRRLLGEIPNPCIQEFLTRVSHCHPSLFLGWRCKLTVHFRSTWGSWISFFRNLCVLPSASPRKSGPKNSTSIEAYEILPRRSLLLNSNLPAKGPNVLYRWELQLWSILVAAVYSDPVPYLKAGQPDVLLIQL